VKLYKEVIYSLLAMLKKKNPNQENKQLKSSQLGKKKMKANEYFCRLFKIIFIFTRLQSSLVASCNKFGLKYKAK